MNSSPIQPDAHPAPESRSVPLTQMKIGQVGIIQEKRLEQGDRAVLRAMGLACNATVKLCRAGEPCIVAVMSGGVAGGRLSGDCCRIGLERPLADKIMVSICEHARSSEPNRAPPTTLPPR